jgi:hypothetical protein
MQATLFEIIEQQVSEAMQPPGLKHPPPSSALHTQAQTLPGESQVGAIAGREERQNRGDRVMEVSPECSLGDRHIIDVFVDIFHESGASTMVRANAIASRTKMVC